MSIVPNILHQPSFSAFNQLRPPRSISQQLQDSKDHPLPEKPSFEDLFKFHIANKIYTLEETLWMKGQRGRSSFIYNHGWSFIQCVDGRSGGAFWACRYGDIKGRVAIFDAKASSSPADHLRKAHKIRKGDETTDSESPHEVQNAPFKRQCLDFSGLTSKKVKSIQEPSVGLVVDANLSFGIYHNPYFQSLISQLDPQLSELPWSQSSITRALEDIYNQKKEYIRALLLSADSDIHLGFDLWTSSNRHAIMAVTAHFLTKQNGPQVLLIALRRQLGAHDGFNLANTLEEVIIQWGISHKIGALIADNASSNDTCLRSLFPRLSPSMTSRDITARRIRCFGHILNLVSKAFLFGNDAESFERRSDAFCLLQQDEEDLQHWRKKGPIGKLHNIVKFVRSSPQRTQRFKRITREEIDQRSGGILLCEETQREVELILDNATRWNSTYLMIE
ncbi:transposase-like protein [Colletotrichum incanum]|uniref:Transposase-like protein n=1 Tax=Colletotrichum incanum TaxID=1573173 RepID=A0A167CKE7_COLIC|nr:transposase-like protein [Colletotrichum incanum]